MKKSILICAALVCAAAAGAQEKWTLRQCIDYALEHNIELRQQELSVDAAEVELNTSRNSRLPNLNANLGQSFGFGRSTSDDDNAYLVNTRTANTSFGLSASLPVFQGFRINRQIGQDELDLKAAMEGLDKARDNLMLAIASYYLDVLFKKEILNVYTEQVELSERQVEMTEKLVANGKVAESQLYDIRSQLAQNETNRTTAANDLAMSLLNLSQALNLQWSPRFDIEVPDTSGAIDDLSSMRAPDLIYTTALGIKPHVREAEYRLESSRRGVDIARSAYWPSVSLGANFDDGYYYRFGSKQNTDLWYQLRNKHSEGIGLNLSIPIFNRFATRNSVRMARINQTNYSLQLENVKLQLYKEIQQAYQGAVAAQAKHESTTRALAAAEEAFRAMQVRYEFGKATVYEFNEAQAKLVSSRSEQLQAKYDFIFRTKILDFYMGRDIEI